MLLLTLAGAENGLLIDIGHFFLTTGYNGRGDPGVLCKEKIREKCLRNLKK